MRTLQDLHTAVLDCEDRLTVARITRDSEIRRLISEGRSMYSIAKALGISQQSVRQIRDAGRQAGRPGRTRGRVTQT